MITSFSNPTMDRLLAPEEAADILGITVGTLSVWRSTGRYPLRFKKIGRRVMYSIADIQHFIAEQTRFGHNAAKNLDEGRAA